MLWSIKNQVGITMMQTTMNHLQKISSSSSSVRHYKNIFVMMLYAFIYSPTNIFVLNPKSTAKWYTDTRRKMKKRREGAKSMERKYRSLNKDLSGKSDRFMLLFVINGICFKLYGRPYITASEGEGRGEKRRKRPWLCPRYKISLHILQDSCRTHSFPPWLIVTGPWRPVIFFSLQEILRPLSHFHYKYTCYTHTYGHNFPCTDIRRPRKISPLVLPTIMIPHLHVWCITIIIMIVPKAIYNIFQKKKEGK